MSYCLPRQGARPTVETIGDNVALAALRGPMEVPVREVIPG
jgi:hypothetical protein